MVSRQPLKNVHGLQNAKIVHMGRNVPKRWAQVDFSVVKPIWMDGLVEDEQNVGVWQPSLLPLNLLDVWLVPGQNTRAAHDVAGNREVHAPCELAPARVRRYQSPTSLLADRPTSC